MAACQYALKPYDCPPWARVLSWLPSHRVQVSVVPEIRILARSGKLSHYAYLLVREADHGTDADPQVGPARHP